jgi:nucleoside phosphorylase
MRVLVTFAVDAEFAPWRRRRAWSLTDALLDAYETTVGQARVFVVLTGVGSGRAWDATAITRWGERSFDIIVSSGLAGALRREHRPGEVLVARTVRDFKAQEPLPCDGELVRLAEMCGAKIVETFYTSDRIVVRAEEKRKLAGLADAVEMESRRVIGQARLPGWHDSRCVAVRAISDRADEDLPLDFNEMLDLRGNVSVRKIIAETIRRPRVVPPLVRFAWQSRHAAKSLAAFLDRYVLALGEGAVSNGKIPLEEVAAT